MVNFNYPWSGPSPMSAVFITVAVVYYVIWLLALAAALGRVDLEPVVRLMWVIVIIFVPVAGILLYGFMARERRFERKRDPSPIKVASPTSGTPWENNPGHVQDRGE